MAEILNSIENSTVEKPPVEKNEDTAKTFSQTTLDEYEAMKQELARLRSELAAAKETSNKATPVKKTNNLEEPATNTPEVDISEGSNEDDEWGEVIDVWLADVSLLNSDSQKTRRNYRKRITDMVDYLTRRGPPLKLPKHLTEEDYQDYLDDLMKRKGHLQKNTLRSYLIPIRSFGTLVASRYNQGLSRAKVIKLPSGEAAEAETISRDDFMMIWTTVSVTRRKVLYTLLWFFHIRIDEAVHVRYCDVYVQDNSKDIEKQRLLKEKARQQKEEAQKRLMTFHDLQNRKPLRRKKQPVPVEATAPTEFADIALKQMIVVFVNKPKGGPKKRRYVAIPEGCVAFEFLKSVCGRTDERYLFPYRGWDDRVPMSTKTARNWMNTDFAIHMNEMTGKKPSPHMMRHSSAAFLKKIGMPEHQIGKRLGHEKKKGKFGRSMTSLYTDHDDIRDVFDNKWLLQL